MAEGRDHADTVIHAGWIVPVEPDGQVLEKHSLVIRDGRILELLPWRDAGLRYRARVTHQRTRHALIPGLVNAHTHAAMSLFRGYAGDLPLEQWLYDRIRPAERKHMSARFAAAGVSLAIAEMLRGGTTCFSDMYYHPDTTARVALRAGMRAVVGTRVMDAVSAGWGAGPEDILEGGLSLYDRYRGNPLITVMLAPHSPENLEQRSLGALKRLAAEYGLRLHTHVHETEAGIRSLVERGGQRPLARLRSTGLLNHRLTAVHMNHLTGLELEQISASGVHVVHCPRSNLKLASGFCPVAELLERGVNVALGTDGCASNDSLDMLDEMRTAALLAKGVAADLTAVPAGQALRMATLNGAAALGIDAETGSLVPGKQADCVSVDMSRLNCAPLYHPVTQLVYAGNRRQITDTWVAGRQLVADGKLRTLDEPHILQQARRWQRRISGGRRGWFW